MGLLQDLYRSTPEQEAAIQNRHQRVVGFIDQLRYRKLGQKFFESGDMTPEGLQAFAKQNNLGIDEMSHFMATAKGFQEFKTGQVNAETAYTKAQADLVKAKSAADFTLKPGEQRFGPQGQQIAGIPGAPSGGFTLSPGQTRYGALGGAPIAVGEEEPQKWGPLQKGIDPQTNQPYYFRMDQFNRKYVVPGVQAPGTAAGENPVLEDIRKQYNVAQGQWASAKRGENVLSVGFEEGGLDVIAVNEQKMRILEQQYKANGGDPRRLGVQQPAPGAAAANLNPEQKIEYIKAGQDPVTAGISRSEIRTMNRVGSITRKEALAALEKIPK